MFTSSISAEISSWLAGIKSNLYSVFRIIELIGSSSIRTSKRVKLLNYSVMPEPDVEFFCESRSTNNTLLDAADREAARFKAVVVFPTPPF